MAATETLDGTSLPEFDFNRAALGRWLEYKSPQGIYARGWLAKTLKRVRAGKSRPEARDIYLWLHSWIRSLEQDALKLRQKMRREIEAAPALSDSEWLRAEILAAFDRGTSLLEIQQALRDEQCVNGLFHGMRLLRVIQLRRMMKGDFRDETQGRVQ